MYFKDTVIKLVECLLCLLNISFRDNKLCYLKCNSAKTHHIAHLNRCSHLLKVLDNEPAVFLYDQIGVALVLFVGKGFMHVIGPIMEHNVHKFLALSLQLCFPLAIALTLRNW